MIADSDLNLIIFNLLMLTLIALPLPSTSSFSTTVTLVTGPSNVLPTPDYLCTCSVTNAHSSLYKWYYWHIIRHLLSSIHMHTVCLQERFLVWWQELRQSVCAEFVSHFSNHKYPSPFFPTSALVWWYDHAIVYFLYISWNNVRENLP